MKTTKVLSLSLAMFAMIGMIGFGGSEAFAKGNGAGGVGKGGFQLNLIGTTQDDKLSNDETNNGHRIFIPMDSNKPTKIYLKEGTEFAVIDSDATDGRGEFQLPPPNSVCVDENGVPLADQSDEAKATCENLETAYGVYARVLGKPTSGDFQITTCAEGETYVDLNNNGSIEADEEICSLETVELGNANGKKGGAKFTNVSKELLTLCIDVADEFGEFDDVCDIRVDIFDDRLHDYFWKVINDNKRLVQLRFIDTPTVS
jgi:hypothetical protein